MKKIVYGMSMDRSKVISKLSGLADPLSDHIIKLGLYPNDRNFNHWLQEVAEYLSIINDITTKPKNRKVPVNLLETYFFGSIGDSLEDVSVNVRLFNIHNSSYPEVKLTPDIVDRVFEIYKVIHECALSLVNSQNDSTSEDILSKLSENIR